MEAQQADSQFTPEIFAFLAETYKDVKKKIDFPTHASSLQIRYDTKLSSQIKDKLYSTFPHLYKLNPFDIDSLLESQILNALKSRNFYKLKRFIHQTITKFLEQFDISSKYNVDEIHKFLQDNLEFTSNTDEIIFQVSEGFKKNKEFTFDSDFKSLNENLHKVNEILKIYQQLLYSKYEMQELYFSNKESIKKDTIKQIFDQAIIDYPKVIRQTQISLKTCKETALKEFKQNFDGNLIAFYDKNPKVSTYVNAYTSSVKYILDIFKEQATEKLGDAPSDVFVSYYKDDIVETVKQAIIQERLRKYVIQDSCLFKNTLYKDLEAAFGSFNYIDGAVKNLFDSQKLGGRENIATLFSIVILTDYLELDESRFFIYFDKLQLIYGYFISDFVREYPRLYTYSQMIDSAPKCKNNWSMIRHHLEIESNKWKEATSESQNLYAMACIFMAFTQTKSEGSSKNYSSHDRYMIKNIFRNMRGGESRFTNFQVLCALESVLASRSSQVDQSQSDLLVPYKKVDEQDDILDKIRNTMVNSFSEHQNHANQLVKFSNQINPCIQRPKKFFLEKISDQNIRSKVINICISGFTSENCKKMKQWKGVLQSNPYTEVFALNWSSNTLKNVVKFLKKEITEITSANAGLVFGFAIKKLKPVLLGMATYKAFVAFKDDLWGKTYQEAINSGIYLAHILSETDLFKGHVINLIGFSLGTLVIMSCIWELERMNRQDIVYDVLLMGGVVNAAEFNRRTLNVIGNKIINCYCKTDYILKFLLKIVSFNTNPIGLGPILCAHKKVHNIDVTRKITGHNEYRKNLEDLLTRVDFNEDINYLLN